MKSRTLLKRTLALFVLLSALVGLVSCAGVDDSGSGGPGFAYKNSSAAIGEKSDGAPSGDVRYDSAASSEVGYADDAGYVEDSAPADLPDSSDGETPSVEDPASDEPRELTEREINELYRAGLITASAWNDNTYYTMWQELFLKGQSAEENGRLEHFMSDGWNLDSTERVVVSVVCGENAVAGAKVVAYDESGEPLYSAVTDAKGKAYLFTSAEAGNVVVTTAVSSATGRFSTEQRELTVELETMPEKKNVIELMFVVDVTGSMGDEIEYLKNELGDVIRRIASSDSETRISLSFLFYRDDGDDEKFCYVDFRDVTDPDDYSIQQAELKKQYATGGGDYPEAMDEALALAVGKQWSSNSTKLIFLVLDAPCHDKQQNKETFSKAVRTAAEKGIRICPILASGADELTEYLTRSAAVLSGGTFVYITDDSGIGNSHYDPDVPNAVVERLNMLIVRLIKGYHTGVFSAPIPWNVEQ